MADISQLELDLDGGVELREVGMARAAANKQEMLELSRDVAEEIARLNGVVTSDDVRYRLNLAPSNKRDSQNWMGAMFTDRRVVWTGRYVKCKIPCNHANNIKVWRLAQ